MKPEQTTQYKLPVCSLARRFAAIFYDTLLLFSVFMVATIILFPLTSGEAISSNNKIYTLYLVLISYLYFAWHWLHGGQTLGMKAWHIRLVSTGQQQISHQDVFKRFVYAICSLLFLGTGFFWAWFDFNRLTFHDRYSKTFPMLVVKKKSIDQAFR